MRCSADRNIESNKNHFYGNLARELLCGMQALGQSLVSFLALFYCKLLFGSSALRSSFIFGVGLTFIATSSFSCALAPPTMSQFMGKTIQESIQLTLSFHKNGQLADALVGYEEVLGKLSADNAKGASVKASLHGNAGAIYLAQGDYQSAKRHFEGSVQVQPENSSSRYNLAVLLTSKLGEHASALKHCALAIKYDKTNYKALHLMGNIMQNLGKAQEAERYFQMAEQAALEQEQQPLQREVSTSTTSSESSGDFRIQPWMQSLLSFDEKIHRVNIKGRDFEVHLISRKPLIMTVDNLLTEDECEAIKQASKDKLERSFTMGSSIKVSGEEKEDIPVEITDDGIEDQRAYRSSYNAWLPRNELLQNVQEWLSEILNLPLAYILQNSEDLQVVHYRTGGQFRAHQDSSAFHPRLLTALLYLNDQIDNGGGETWFPFTSEEATVSSVEEAVLQALTLHDLHITSAQADLPGIKVAPRTGKAVIFFNHLPTGEIDPKAVHAGLPTKIVESGEHSFSEKWIANYWVELDKKVL